MEILSEQRCAAELARLPHAEPRIVASGNFATPIRLLELAEGEIEAFRIFVLNAQPPLPRRAGIIYETPFVGPGMRGVEHLDYLPMRLSLVPQLFARSRPPDLVFVQTSAPRSGRVSLGIEVNILPAAIEQARARGGLVFAQVNPSMPYTRGDGELDTDLIDFAIEHDAPLPSPGIREVDPLLADIGRRVGSLIGDGATLQLGIGQIPDAALAALLGHRGLRIWSEMVSDGVLALDRAGALEDGPPITTSFLFGSPELYEWAQVSERLRVDRTETVNDPSRIATHWAMTSVNSALQVDLYAQANASYVGGRVYSGFGGQTDFVVGALHAPEGQAIIALPSLHARSQSSTIVPLLATPATSFQHSTIVTEQGEAHIFGRSQRAQARVLTDVAAHPDARDELREAAERLGLRR